MFPMIPKDLDLTKLSASELSALIKEIKAKAKEFAGSDLSPEQVDEVGVALQVLADAEKALPKAVAAERLSAIAAEPEVEEEADVEETEDLADAPDDDDDDDVEEDEEAEELAVKPAPKPAKVRTRTGLTSTPEKELGQRPANASPDKILASDNLRGIKAGERFDNWTQVAMAIQDRAESVRSNTSEKFEVAYVPANYKPEDVLDPNPTFNLHLFDQQREEQTAALCTLPDPVYDLACWNDTSRPVFASLRKFQGADRGSVSIFPSPSLADITTGYGKWEFEDDDDPEAEKTCATIECGEPETYRWYAIYRCLTIKHMMAMTMPELVEAWMNRLHAAQVRYAEQLLLEAMATGATTVNASALGYNASTTVASTILEYLHKYEELERWNAPGMDVWLPRWLKTALKVDQIRRRRTDGSVLRQASDAEIDALFTDVGFTPHWYLDTPSWGTTIPKFSTSNTLGQLPRNLKMLVAPKGKFALIDKGRLSIGVTGNNMYRDTTNLLKNEITFFVESFEGVVNTTSCPAHLITVPNLCYNGQQIADVAIDCEGQDYAGVGS